MKGQERVTEKILSNILPTYLPIDDSFYPVYDDSSYYEEVRPYYLEPDFQGRSLQLTTGDNKLVEKIAETATKIVNRSGDAGMTVC